MPEARPGHEEMMHDGRVEQPRAVTSQAVRRELRTAVRELRDSGLHHASLWAAEQLVGLRGDDPLDDSATAAGLSQPEPRVNYDDTDAMLLARRFFDAKQYFRAAATLSNHPGTKALFLRCYALYLAGEKRREEARMEESGPLGKNIVQNRELGRIESLLRSHPAAGSDGLCLYLLGVILAQRLQRKEAVAVLLQSLNIFPCNWSAWQALQTQLAEQEALSGVSLPPHWTRSFFHIARCLELQANQEALGRLGDVADLFPASDWVLCYTATAHYNLRNFNIAQELFEELRQRDPHRMEGMDTYSNVLYVKDEFASLSAMAHSAVVTEKYCPESACIVGNYYSMKGDHEKAVTYFRRALKLDRNCLSAWTLMGHEYVELQNISAAIEAYRRAVDVNPRDFRAWYGLGQTYELMHLPYYALYYFRRATQLRPEDARMWCAMGLCYECDALKLESEALRCYRRALALGDKEGVALHKLALLHEKRGETAEAAHYHGLALQAADILKADGQDTVHALEFLAEHSMATDIEEAEKYATRLLDHGPTAKEKAKALLRRIHAAARTSIVASALQTGLGDGTAEGMLTNVSLRQTLAVGRTRHLSPVTFPSYQGVNLDTPLSGLQAESDNSDIDTGSD